MRSVVELYNFLQHKYLPITPDGCFIAYKGLTKYSGPESTDKMGRKLVSGDLVDKYTGKSYRNNVGDKNSMHRRNVDDDANRGCSEGLHVGSLEYATEYASGGDVVLCKIDPANVVSVPHDCNCQKVRVSEYEVVGIYNQEHKLEKAVESFSFENEFNFDEEDFEEDSEIDPYAGDGWSE